MGRRRKARNQGRGRWREDLGVFGWKLVLIHCRRVCLYRSNGLQRELQGTILPGLGDFSWAIIEKIDERCFLLFTNLRTG